MCTDLCLETFRLQDRLAVQHQIVIDQNLTPAQDCIERYSPWPGCKSCIPQCFHWDGPNAMVCVDYNDKALQSNMFVWILRLCLLYLTLGRCLGSQSELGFCVAAGGGIFVDNGGSGCGGTTPDCDVVPGIKSQCPASSFSGSYTTFLASSVPLAESGNSIPLSGEQQPQQVWTGQSRLGEREKSEEKEVRH